MNSFKHFVCCIALSALLFGCNNKQAQVSESAEAVSDTPSSTVSHDSPNTSSSTHKVTIPLKVTRLCGNKWCQSYQAAIYQNQITFEQVTPVLAGSNTAANKPKNLTEKSASELNSLIADLKLVALNTQIIPGQKNCTNYVTDQPTYTIELDKGQFPQTLELYTGCNNIPNQYRSLLKWISNTLESNPSS